MREPTDEEVEAFRAGWLRADEEGRAGERIREGLRSLEEHLSEGWNGDVEVLSPKVLREVGYLQEVNRIFFHPVGLALAVDPEEPVDAKGRFHVQVWDYREDPEGMFFGELTDEEDREKRDAVEAQALRLCPGRVKVEDLAPRDPVMPDGRGVDALDPDPRWCQIAAIQAVGSRVVAESTGDVEAGSS